jgi:ABC-type antimicrobial peptide transport system permease subunit
MFMALCIIISALVLGSATGLSIAITLTLQFNLFTEMPFRFQFPYLLFASLILMSLAVAIGGSYLASSDIKKKQIAQVLKGSL